MMKNPCKVTFSNDYLKRLQRLKNLTKDGIALLKAPLHRDALLTMKNFKEGIKTRAFGLKELTPGTIKRKQLLGQERPETPLYGMGDEKKRNSYINMLRIKNIKGGFMVSPSKNKHYSRKIELNRLWAVHELGTTINLGERQSIKTKVVRGKTIIRIPPRPALLMAFRKTMAMRNMKRDAKLIKVALQKYAMTGKKNVLTKAEKNFTKGLMQYEERN